mmetsp:Transcript_20364/g.24448  ORF Transcript_20364/g.24448 Transcript_20364/m.24448 type:complete len:197 (-) Transcript_20364:68-658(-)|eukprot:CAMPEP_0197847794 /NCGR_PEP_ID=MMETSP1438-20131217/7113_1 /TAXON_ID=1461541 /ORGANISM="Pterosperma sp., Strain CCMP1384" /LENGTH=196 /DNA_ID=CAMNT_0043459817 /DNA_START=48 /DNA_END=638 /DNA_ORIENTATION=+
MNRIILRGLQAARRVAVPEAFGRQLQLESRQLASTASVGSRVLETAAPNRILAPFALSGCRSFNASPVITKEDDTHEDFKPISHVEVTEDVNEYIQKIVSENKVFIFMKGHPTAPRCGFSNMACRVLDHYGVPYGSVDVLQDPELREAIKKFSNWPTIPQVYMDGEFVGGSDILMSMHQSGELKEMMDEVQPSKSE